MQSGSRLSGAEKTDIRASRKRDETFTARFTVTERSLYQLLYDKVDDWVNPEY